MDAIIEKWPYAHSPEELERIAQLWNRNASGRHAFFPWTGEHLHRLLTANGKPLGTLIIAREGDRCIGFSHINQVIEDGYPIAGCVEALLVDEEHRRKGLGGALLTAATSIAARYRPLPMFIDALGAWPFGYIYNALSDGSERSGVFVADTPLLRLFQRHKFQPVRRSIVMRARVDGFDPRPAPEGCGFYMAKRNEFTWLDRVFRGRELWDFDLARADGRILSRAIFGFMENVSKHEGRAVFSLFGVNTPRDAQNKGYATINLSNLMAHVRDLGGEALEIHVYADNTPALALYRRLGFEPLAETMMMHKRL